MGTGAGAGGGALGGLGAVDVVVVATGRARIVARVGDGDDVDLIAWIVAVLDVGT
jgi:hypothetical protein